ncbi:MAG TPA: type II secretion system F family protein [archaeon]|nr:type II secretion system F family protein [archaeon]
MELKLMQNTPGIKGSSFLTKYASYLHSAEFRVDPLIWIVFSLVASALVGAMVWYVAGVILVVKETLQLTVLISFVALDVLIGYPYFKAEQRIEQIEGDLPDALRQMSDTLKSGGTYEYALREVVNSDLGPLKKEIGEVLKKLEEGENFETALRTLSYNVDSRLVRRTITIIIDSVAAGAGLANVLEEIAEDVRESHRIQKERKARTVLQVIFMFAAGGVIAPMIFGFVSTISKVLLNASAAAVSAERVAESNNALGVIELSIQGYIFVMSIATGIMISVMREGKISKSIIYIPVLLCIAYISYLLAGFVSGLLVGVGS